MPPKRKQTTTKSSSSTPATSKPRRSKLAKENNLTPDQESEIREAFDLFCAQESPKSNSEAQIATPDIRRALIALNTPASTASELKEILSTIDPDESGWVNYETFLAIAALKLHSRHDEDPDEEVAAAYALFTKGEDREIGIADLRRVARELREEVPEKVLRDMILEATAGEGGGVGREEFEGVMRRAGVFG